MKTSSDYVPVRLKRRSGITQNKVTTNPALVTTQMSISASILVNFETHFGSKFLSKTEFWRPLNEDDDSDIIVAL